MNQLDDTTFDRPIPGMGMTHEVGARPWQTPPTYTTVEEASDYYIERHCRCRYVNDTYSSRDYDVDRRFC